MRRSGIMNRELAAAMADLGHTDTVVVADVGLPRPQGVQVIDLAVTFGVPSFRQLLDLLAVELVCESALVATEMSKANDEAYRLVEKHFGKPREVSHEDFKAELPGARLIIRTGEATPFANVALRCGVPF